VGVRRFARTIARGAGVSTVGGKRICPHKRRRSACGECRGKEICEHNRQRRQCVECRGKETY
jgi:hypothetical protein